MQKRKFNKKIPHTHTHTIDVSVKQGMSYLLPEANFTMCNM